MEQRIFGIRNFDIKKIQHGEYELEGPKNEYLYGLVKELLNIAFRMENAMFWTHPEHGCILTKEL